MLVKGAPVVIWIDNVLPISWIASVKKKPQHNIDVIMTTMASQITNLTVVYSTVYSDADQRKHQSSASLAFVRGIHRWPVNSPHKGLVTRKMFPFDDVIMRSQGMSSYGIDLVYMKSSSVSHGNSNIVGGIKQSLMANGPLCTVCLINTAKGQA